MFKNYVALDGYEVINGMRTAAYAHNMGLGWFSGCDTCDTLKDLSIAPPGDGSTPPPVFTENSYGYLRVNADTMRANGHLIV